MKATYAVLTTGRSNSYKVWSKHLTYDSAAKRVMTMARNGFTGHTIAVPVSLIGNYIK